jgi:copper resistance protein B
MSTHRPFSPAVSLALFANIAAAQMPGMEPGGAVQPVMDRKILAHVLFNELEGRFNGTNTEFRWDGQGWVGTDYDKLWIKSEGTLRSSGTLDDGKRSVKARDDGWRRLNPISFPPWLTETDLDF